MKYIKPATYIFLSIFVFIFFYYSYKTQQQLDITNTNPNSTNENGYKGIISIPVSEENLIYNGTIRESGSEENPYTLNNEDKKVLLYLKSDNQDLSLLAGLQAEIVGDIVGKSDGIAIMNVKSIKLK